MILTEPSNDSQMIAAYAEVIKYTVKFNMPKKCMLKVMISFFFVQFIILKCSYQLLSVCEILHVFSLATQEVAKTHNTRAEFN